ncbi:MAG: NAD(P)H-dependent oxidoreductase subunit E [Phycisphaerae bacterium]|nr:MAG: NAD(P)H-dependent oxidoreductase subunit E [Planctomycetota bacterium]KAB2940722.1 MAG: NAD(P)H-dependent oxidoreductase subunit E [Phycisphaerae bacterium]MBE7458466.1 NAD(P)H-dependent oxidoreductase subunit E [Planctomycetia bacterium]MCK6464902.1 NAD(P)H-dependent oxidoreductase subunit E [Phycisphaerae bacterium]MCL4719209.1 NAD(P)H-dependent oxidoreductase subunit E [Phycisphaerae bacterium]
MSWKTLDRNTPAFPKDAPAALSEPVREKIRSFFPRYATKRAVLLPALHVVQDALGHVSMQAMKEIAELLEIHPSEVMDTVSFYTHFWTHPKGEKVIVACRSISCEALGGQQVIDAVKQHLHVKEHGTTADGKYSFMTEECLAGCDHAPCLLIGERMHQQVRAEDVPKLLADPDNDRIAAPRSALFDAPAAKGGATNGRPGGGSGAEAVGITSDIREMREA